MPDEISIMTTEFFRQLDSETSPALSSDITESYIAFAYPGYFIGVGESWEEAMQMAKLRLRKAKKDILDSGKTEHEWKLWAANRHIKIFKALEKFGIGPEQVWGEDNVTKKE